MAHSIKARKKNLNLKGFKYSSILTPRCSAVRPWLLATLTLASLSSSSDTESTWPPATASIRGVLQTRIRGCVRERNDRLNNLEQMKENWKKRKQKRITHCPWESAASTRSALSDSSSRRRTHVVWPFITGGSDGERESVTVGEQETGSNRNVFLVTKQQKIRSKVLKRVSSVLIRNHNKYLQWITCSYTPIQAEINYVNKGIGKSVHIRAVCAQKQGLKFLLNWTCLSFKICWLWSSEQHLEMCLATCATNSTFSLSKI